MEPPYQQPFLAAHATHRHQAFLLCPHHHFFHRHRYHHHHHHHHPFCSLKPQDGRHNLPFHHHCHFHLNPSFASPPPPPTLCSLPGKPQASYSVSTPNDQNLEVSECKEAEDSGAQLLEEWTEELELEEEEPVFVMTDEWMEFFAKSEAKRRLEKKQAKKKGKKVDGNL